ncbi:MAG: protein translocase subunit SecF [Caulobacterales bacterium]|nr:protein translocase subunit SecF [Caulobacterales bacterium]
MAFLLRLVPHSTAIPFIAARRYAFMVSGALIALSLFAALQMGLNFGIDFRGGTQIEIETPGPADLGEIRTVLSARDLGDVQVQEFGAANDVLIRIERQAGEGVEGEDAQQNAARQVRDALTEAIPGVEFRRSEVVGPVVSGELARAGTIAISLSLALMFIYIWFRFDGWQFSLGAVAAIAHDVALTIGMFALTRIEFNLSIIAAILTIVGYSINDTVVVYDRIRENMRKFKKLDLPELLNLSINNTLSRTVMTSLTTLIALFALFFLGGEGLRGFSFAMIWGVIVGTYSSVFVAAPILLMTGVRSAPAEAPAEA